MNLEKNDEKKEYDSLLYLKIFKNIFSIFNIK